MLFWTKFPFARITILFALGIWTGAYIPLPFQLILIIWTFSWLCYLSAYRYVIRGKFRRFNLAISFLALSPLFLSGNLLMHLQKVKQGKIEKTILNNQVEYYLATVILSAGETDRYQKTIAKISLVQTDEERIHLPGKVLLYIPSKTPVGYGDQLVVAGNPLPFDEPVFPGEFNYKVYMWQRGILFQQFLAEEDYIRIGAESTCSLKQLAYRFREYLIRMIRERIGDARVQALMIALTTGKRDYFDPETYAQFLGAGIVHILAVSGLHVGILYFLLIQLTRPLAFTLTGRWIRLVIILPFFLFFSFVTGLSPSVLRSVVMFSILLLGITFDRKSPALNSVFLSAFLLLCFDPGLLWQVAFQLSYFAVLGIILFQPLFQSMWRPKYSLIRWPWNLVMVSISAQLATLPLSLLYFKQFPTYFLLSNLFAIPFATVFLPGSIVFICTYFLDPLNRVIAVLLEQAGKVFIQIIGIINGLPGSLIYPVNIGTLEAVFFILMVACLYLILRFREYRLFRFMPIILGILITKDALNYFYSSAAKKILTYSIAGSPVVELVDGFQSFIILQNRDSALSEKVRYHTGNYHLLHHLESRIIPIEDLAQYIPSIERNGSRLIFWNGRSLFFGDSSGDLGQDCLNLRVPDFWFELKNYRYELRLEDKGMPTGRKNLIARLFDIFRKNKKFRIEMQAEWTSISL